MEIRGGRARLVLGVVLVGMLVAAGTALAANQSGDDDAFAVDAGAETKAGPTKAAPAPSCGSDETIGFRSDPSFYIAVCLHRRFIDEDGRVAPNPLPITVIVANRTNLDLDVFVEMDIPGMVSTNSLGSSDSWFTTVGPSGTNDTFFFYGFTATASDQIFTFDVTTEYGHGAANHVGPAIHGQFEIPAEPAVGTPGPPTNLRFVPPETDLHPYFEWDPPATPPAITHYELRHRSTSSETLGDNRSPRFFSTTTPKFDLTLDGTKTTHYFRVRACNQNGCGPWSTELDRYIGDPRGVVVDQGGTPIAGATVTLLRAERGEGLIAVPDGSYDLGANNRANPSTSDELGRFRWDAPPGRYVVRAAKDGCVAGDESGAPFAQTHVFETPPDVVDLVLTLDCDVEGRS